MANLTRGLKGQSMAALPSDSDINLFCDVGRVVNLNSEMSDRALGFLYDRAAIERP